MNEVDRLKQRRRRRQEAYQTLAQVDDFSTALLQAFQGINARVEALRTRRIFFLFHPAQQNRLLAEIAEQTAKASLLAEVTNRVKAIRGEFSALQHSDERELKELGVIPHPPTPTR